MPEKDVLDSNCLMTTTQLMNSVDLTRRRTEGERGAAELHKVKEKSRRAVLLTGDLFFKQADSKSSKK